MMAGILVAEPAAAACAASARRAESTLMDAVGFALASAITFGATTVAMRVAFRKGALAEGGALFTVLVALAVVLPFALAQGGFTADVWPFLLAGLLGPGHLAVPLHVRGAGGRRGTHVRHRRNLAAVRDRDCVRLPRRAARSRARRRLPCSSSSGGILLVTERDRPEHVRRVGLVLALVATIVFAMRDNLVRWLAVDTEVPPAVGALATLAAGAALMAVFVLVRRAPLRAQDARAFAPAGPALRCCRTSASSRRTTAASSRSSRRSSRRSRSGAWPSRRSFSGESERVGPRLVVGALLVVAGGVLIGIYR